MSSIIRIADSKGRVSLPGFANSTVIVEALSANEYRIRKAAVIPADDLEFPEEQMPTRLSLRDAKSLVKTLAKPPRPNAAARQAAKRFKKSHG